MKVLIIHLRKDAELLGFGSSTIDLSKVLLCCEILWYSTVLKQYRLLMSEGSSCPNSSGCRSNISNHYYFYMMLAKYP